MGRSSDQLQREIGSVRDSMESTIVQLRDRGQRQVRRLTRTAVIALGAGAAVGVVAVGVYVTYRVTRPPTGRERLERLIPLDWRHWFSRTRSTWELDLRKRIPSLRLYIGERAVGEKPPESRLETIAVRVAKTAGTAAGSALASALVSQLSRRLRQRSSQES
jgi:hypothetical protein